MLNEIKSLVKLAAPVSLGQLAIMGMGATDVVIAAQAGTVDLAGMNLGTNVWHMVILFFSGVGFATQPLIANQFGAHSDVGIKYQFHQSIWMCMALGLLGMSGVLIASWVLSFIPYEAGMRVISQQFLLVISLAALPMCVLPALRGTLEGMGLTAVVFWINLSAFLINIPLDYVLVHGLWGFPKLGGVGCAWATVVLVWLMAILLTVVLNVHRKVQSIRLLTEFAKPDHEAISRTLKLGLPIGLSIMIELSMFSGAGMMIASFGAIEAGAHAVAITIASLSFMFYMGLGQGITIRASQFIGANDYPAAKHTIKVGLLFNFGLSVLFCFTFWWLNEAIVTLFSDDLTVIKLASVLLIFGALFQISDCMQISIICALRAYHDTASPPKYQIFSFWVLGLPLGTGLAFYQWWPGFEGAKGMWMAMVISLMVVSLLLLARLIAVSQREEASSLRNQQRQIK